ncbi:Uu.00g063990.m01.CDS01 [Anthostomella pinea]|uniref:Uu.00g063990.m01.CDS01 n=1 Tax=Anthostomella pinea TaxID=933095 RepID=A0AAI8YMY1_9PEZI|nr:Uu.00g063990.m01.CDS01 [Anthostomella pinea]
MANFNPGTPLFSQANFDFNPPSGSPAYPVSAQPAEVEVQAPTASKKSPVKKGPAKRAPVERSPGENGKRTASAPKAESQGGKKRKTAEYQNPTTFVGGRSIPWRNHGAQRHLAFKPRSGLSTLSRRPRDCPRPDSFARPRAYIWPTTGSTTPHRDIRSLFKAVVYFRQAENLGQALETSLVPIAEGHRHSQTGGDSPPTCTANLNQTINPNTRDDDDGDDGNVEPGYPVEHGYLRDDAVSLLRRFYVQENGRAPQPRKKEGRAVRLYAQEKRSTALSYQMK